MQPPRTCLVRGLMWIRRRSWTAGCKPSGTRTGPWRTPFARSSAPWASSRTSSGRLTGTSSRTRSWTPRRKRSWTDGCWRSGRRTSAPPTPSARSFARPAWSPTRFGPLTEKSRLSRGMRRRSTMRTRRRSWTAGCRPSATRTSSPPTLSAPTSAHGASSRTLCGRPATMPSSIRTSSRNWTCGCRPRGTRTSGLQTPSARS
mmetsp:Transcript_104323/g.326416  ORF Transcript_104323/g.326416 Transcript_104323/m.326416 type:complete len:202 (-) Transcript_104323:1127-1732(-)